jgi:hypothetical protein
MLFVLFGVMCCLAVLDPALNLPESFENGTGDKKPSFLFYKLIAEGKFGRMARIMEKNSNSQ